MKNEVQYYNIPDLENTYLEDSFVLKVIENKRELIFYLDVVLTEEHPFYFLPKVDEPYCYKKAQLIFSNCYKIDWIKKTFTVSIDANGEIDYGNIDTFTYANNNYHLIGSWGEVKVECDRVDLAFLE